MSSFDSVNKVWRGKNVPFQYQDAYIGQIIMENLRKTPNRILQIYYDESNEMTCRELCNKAEKVSNILRKDFKVKADDVIGVICRNSKNVLPLVVGSIFIGGILNPISVEHDYADIKHVFGQTCPAFVFCDSDMYEIVKRVLRELKNEAKICTLLNRNGKIPFFDDLLSLAHDEKFSVVKFEKPSERVFTILCSSGTTGMPKGVCLSQDYFLQWAQFTSIPKPIKSLSFVPIFWVSSFGSLLLSTMTNSIKVITKEPFNPKTCIDIVQKYKIEHLWLNPPMLNDLLDHSASSDDLKSVKIISSAGANLSPELWERCENLFPDKLLLSCYGLTEVTVTWSCPGQGQERSVGIIFPNNIIKIVDDSGQSLDINQTGEICVKSPTMFLGYCGNSIETGNSFDKEHFFRTGDCGSIDNNGFVHISDRKKDIFKFHLYQITPMEIENVIASIKGVKYVSVVGVKNESKSNELIAAVVVKCNQSDLTEADIVDYVKKQMPYYKQIHGGVYLIDNLPLTPSGKVVRRKVKEIAEAKYKQKFI